MSRHCYSLGDDRRVIRANDGRSRHDAATAPDNCSVSTVGQITLRFAAIIVRLAAIQGETAPARKNSFRAHFQYATMRATPVANFFSFSFSEIVHHACIPPRAEGRFAIVTTREAGMRWTRWLAV
jgi:hypothetical protein